MGDKAANYVASLYTSTKRMIEQSLRNLQVIVLPPQLDEEVLPANVVPAPPPPRLGFAPNNQLDQPLLILGFCFTAINIPMIKIQNLNHIPIAFHVACLMLILCFTALFLSIYISKNSEPALGKVLQYAGVFFGATVFFLATTMFFPLWLKLISWSIYALSLLWIYLSYRFN